MPGLKATALPALVAALAGCGAPTGPAGAAPPPRTADAARGRDVADRNCSLCHAIAPDGAASRHPQAPAFAALGARYPVDALRAGLSTGAVIGHRGMPQIELAPSEIDDLIAYLRSIAAPSR